MDESVAQETELANAFEGEQGDAGNQESEATGDDQQAELDLDLAGETESEGEEQEKVDTDPVLEFKVDGQLISKKQSELIAEASKYHGANKRFEEAAAIRKEAESKMAQIPEREQQLNQVLTHYIQQSQAFMPQEPDWRALIAYDQQNGTRNYEMQRLDWEQRQRDLFQAQQAKQILDQRNAEAQKASYDRTIADEMSRIGDVIPEWKDPQKAAEGAKAVEQYLLSSGLPKEMIGSIDNAKVLAIAWKAKLYDDAIARQKAARQAVKQPTVTARPGAREIAPPKDVMKRANAGKAFKADPSIDTLSAFFGE